jgi:hypothetical protein
MFALQQLELADGSATRIIGLPLSVLRRLHSACIDREAVDPPHGPG